MSEREAEAVLWDVLRGAMTTKALGVVVDLGIPRSLADGARPVAELAREAGASQDVMQRVLRALASDGIFTEVQPGVFGHTDRSKLLLGPGWADFAHLFSGVFYRAVDGLDSASRTGRPRFADDFGSDFWAWLGTHADERTVFDRAMAGDTRQAERLATLEWREGETVVDVGGGNGSLLLELFRDRPDVYAVVFDLPETNRDEGSFPDNIEFVEGSFFERVPAGDAYLLSAILHDWDDERATAILRTIRGAARPGARVLVAETVIEPGNDPDGAKWLDLLMLVLAGGRERTEPEWRTLLEGAGLEPLSIENGLIEARCP